jgi:hypothetical protein
MSRVALVTPPLPDPLTPPLKAPLTSADCDLRGLAFMPLDVARLVDSDMVALTSGEEFKAAVILWCKCWLQVPAASLPDDDRVLAHLTGAGPRWARVKAQALRGFVLCSDGRWYHPVVAEKAREAWRHRSSQRDKANRRWAKVAAAAGSKAGETAVPEAKVAPGVSTRSTRTDGPGREGEGQREAQGQNHVALMLTLCDLAGMARPATPAQIAAQTAIVRGWIEAGFDPDRIIGPAIRAGVAQADQPTRSLRRFDAAVRHEGARQRAKTGGKALAALAFDREGEDEAVAGFRRALLAAIGEAPYRRWFDGCRIARDGDIVRLVFANAFRAQQAPRNHSDVVERLAAQALAARMVAYDVG